MGYNTTVVILNDALNSLREDKTFTDRLFKAILSAPLDGQVGRGIDVPIGCYVNGCYVAETHHASHYVPVLVGGNTALPVTGVYIRDGHFEELELNTLKALASKHGYSLRKKPKKDT